MEVPTHLAAKRQRVQPIVMGLTPPSFLFKVIRVAPKKYGLVAARTPPLMTKLIKVVRDLIRRLEPAPGETSNKSLRSCGHKPLGPPADPVGKAWMALITSDVDATIGAWLGIRGEYENRGGEECFLIYGRKILIRAGQSNSPSKVTLFQFAGNSSCKRFQRVFCWSKMSTILMIHRLLGKNGLIDVRG